MIRPMSSKIEMKFSGEKELGREIERELDDFNKEFKTLQSDSVGMIPPERALLKTYLIWRLHVRPPYRE
jgi:hypothetical protein